MQLNFEKLIEPLEKITNSKNFISSFINEIEEKLKKMENVKEYTIDRKNKKISRQGNKNVLY